jgi:hypothetical protein
VCGAGRGPYRAHEARAEGHRALLVGAGAAKLGGDHEHQAERQRAARQRGEAGVGVAADEREAARAPRLARGAEDGEGVHGG